MDTGGDARACDCARRLVIIGKAMSEPAADAQPPFGAYAPTPLQRRMMAAAGAMPASWLGRRIAFGLRRVGMHGLDHALDVEVFGQRMRLYPFRNVSAKRLLFTPQHFDPEERTLLARKVAAARGEFVFVDIGANVGGYTLFVAGAARGHARILAFEPQPEVRDQLAFNVAQNPGARIKVFPCALADREGEMELFLSETNKGESSLRPATGEGRAVRIPVRTLLGVVREEGLSRIDALKIDVEGAEDLVLAPFLAEAEGALLPRLVIIEESRARWRSDCIALMEERGYRIVHRSRGNLVLERAGA